MCQKTELILGVWADQHGATWDTDDAGFLVPIPKGIKNKTNAQCNSASYLNDKRLSRGLSDEMQKRLSQVNDSSKSFSKVVAYIKKNVLPLAK